MTLAETLRRGRRARARVPVRDAAEDAPTKPVAGTQPEPGAAASEPTLRDWIGVLAMGTGLFMAIMDVQIVTSSLTQIQGGLSASTDEIAWVQTAYLIAVLSVILSLSSTLGPTLGGFLTVTLSWHWLFLVNIVPGLAVAAIVWATIDINKPDLSLLRHFDLLGMLLMATFLGCLQYAFEEGPRSDWLDDSTISIAVVVSLVGGGLFFW